MSYCELIVFENGIPSKGVEFGNAWGGGARIWTALFDARVPKTDKHDSWMMSADRDRRLWDIATRQDVPMFERAVHAFTFDLFYAAGKNFGKLAADLRQFVETYPTPGNVDHLPAWAKWLDENQGVEAVGLYGTSVGENLWYRYRECEACGNTTDETEPVPLSEGTEVYGWLCGCECHSREAQSAELTGNAVAEVGRNCTTCDRKGTDACTKCAIY